MNIEQIVMGFILNAVKNQEFKDTVTVDIGGVKLSVPVVVGPITEG